MQIASSLIYTSLSPLPVSANLSRDDGNDIRVGTELFRSIVTAECYKLDTNSRKPLELWYKNRWNIMGDIPAPVRIAV